MKYIFLIIIFFFSSNAYSDDLSGNTIFCKADGKTIYIMAIEFTKEDSGFLTFESSNMPMEILEFGYVTSARRILIEQKKYQEHTYFELAVDRKSLEVWFEETENIVFQLKFSNQCRIMKKDENIYKLFDKAFEEQKKTNIL